MNRETSFVVSVPDEASARAVAARLAERGHLLVAVRPETSGRFAGWSQVFSLVVDPPREGPLAISPAERAAVTAVARPYGGRVHGACGQYPDEAIEDFHRAGLVHELDRAEADRIRARLTAEQEPRVPSAPAARGLKCGRIRGARGELRAVAAVLRRTGSDVEVFGENAGDVIAGIADAAMHQGSAGPETAAQVPVLAGLASARGISELFRTMALLVLFQASTAGRRRLAAQADVATGEFPDEAAARQAVADAVPGMRVRGELAGFVFAGLAASCRQPGPGLDRIERRHAGTARVPVVRLIRAVAAGDPDATRAAVAEVVAARPALDLGGTSPKAAAEDLALEVLDTVLQEELDDPRLPLLSLPRLR
jgi:hypothetical protein